MKSHISPDGPGRCTAKPGNCPFGGQENHFSTIAEAKVEYQARLEKAYDTLTSVTRPGYRLSPAEEALRSKNFELAQQLVEARSARGDVTFEDANPERAERRLQEAVSYAQSRSNHHLATKLTSARVLPSGAFKTEEGERVNTDALLKAYSTIKAVEASRDEALKTLATRIGSTPVGTKFQHKDSTGSYTLTVAEGFSEEEFEKMPPKLQAAVSSEREVLDVTLAAQKISPEKFREITNESQVLDFVVGKKPADATAIPAVPLRSEGTLEDGLKDIATFYGEVHETTGKVRDLRSKLTTGGDAIKAVAAKKRGNVFAPARSQANGALVSGRRTINPDKAKELLTPAELASITSTKVQPDMAKAASTLTRPAFDKIFKAKKVSLRVLEAKD